MNNQEGNNRRYFRASSLMLVRVLALLNEDSNVEKLGVSKEDGEFMVSYTFNDGPKPEEAKLERKQSFNHVINVAPYALAEFLEIINTDSSVCQVYVEGNKDDTIVLYLHE